MKNVLKKDYKIVSLLGLRQLRKSRELDVDKWSDLILTSEQEKDLLNLMTSYQIKEYNEEKIKKCSSTK